jgi:hypothetical protein
MARSRPSRYRQLKHLETASADQPSGNIVAFAADHQWRPNIKYNVQGVGPTLHIEPKQGETYDVTFLLALPNLWKPFADGLLAKFCNPQVESKSRRKALVRNTRNQLTRYFVETGQETLTLEEMNRTTINSYVTWLTAARKDGKTLASNTRSMSLGVLRRIIEELRANPSYASRISKRLSFPSNPWPGSSASRKPTPILNDEHWKRLYFICVKEVSQTIETITRQLQEISEISNSVRLDGPPRYYRNETVLLAALAKAVPGAVPNETRFYKVCPNLAQALFKYHSLDTIRALNPFLADLMAFIVLLELYTNYNAEPLLTLELDSIERQVVMGTERVVLSPYKARARRKQIRSFAVSDDPISVSAIVDFLIEWTKHIRTDAPPEYRNRLFLFTPETKSRGVRSFGLKKASASEDRTFHRNLYRFLKRHELPAITMRELRATGLEFIHQLFNGDLRAVQAAGGQRRPQVINDHYTSDAARRRNDERLANVMATRERWQASNGRVDPRGTPEHQDLGACTPGWTCADPYASPIPGEHPGRLCGAFGACSVCPLASIDPTLPSVLANLLALKREIEHAQNYLPAQRWMQRWAPCLARLNEYWLPYFQDPVVIEAAARLTLPRFPRLD